MARTNWSRNQANDGKDHLGRYLRVGDKVLKPTMSGRSAVLEIRYVSRIENGKVWLDDTHVPLNYSGRVYIVDSVLGVPS